ncbi:MAG: YcgJ family protein [Synechococcus sp.]
MGTHVLSRRHLALLAGGLGMLAPALPAAAQLAYPANGVVCDGQAKVCVDRSGPSLGFTGLSYGPQAQQTLEQQIGNGRPEVFRFSNGKVCSLAARTCWEGWNSTDRANDLTRRLFGSVPFVTSRSPTGGYDLATGTMVGGGGTPGAMSAGLCSLSSGAARVFDGPCDLRQVTGGGNDRLRIQMANGAVLRFINQGGRYSIADQTGIWPVTYVDHGPTAIFRWSSNVLVATQRQWGGARQAEPINPSNQSLGQFIDSLFR